MTSFLSGTGTVLALELRQRVRGVAWYVLLGVFTALVALVTVLLSLSIGVTGGFGGFLFSGILFFVLLLGTLVTPALSGNAINGDRDAGTLATTQVTLLTTGQLVLGKFLAAWLTALAFLAASLPFLAYAVVVGDIDASTIAVSIVVLAVELGVVAAIGVGLSGVLARPLFSVVVTYLAVAALSIGTLIIFTLAGIATTSAARSTTIDIAIVNEDVQPPAEIVCAPPVTTTSTVSRFDYYWGLLAANPYVVLADAAAGRFDASGNPSDLFSATAVSVRAAQIPPDLDATYDFCAEVRDGRTQDVETSEEVFDRTVPTWFVGLGIHLLLATGALVWAIARTRTPAARLPRGSRIA
jgi:ABC-type transport system involved in multi-copper enzyme maturation permease subunit